MPSYADLSVTGGAVEDWGRYKSNVLGMALSATGERRSSSMVGAHLKIDLTITGDTSHAVCLHLLDWNQKGRSAKVELFDAATGRSLDVKNIPRYDQGLTIAYQIKGHVIINVVSLSGSDVALSGISFGWRPEIEYAGRRADNAAFQSIQNPLGTAGRWIIGGDRSLPTDTFVSIVGQTNLLRSVDSSTGKLSTPFLGITDPVREIEACINGSESLILTIYLRDVRSAKPKANLEYKQSITINAFDLPGRGKLRASGFRPDKLGANSYVSYVIRGHVKFTISDAGGAASALCGIFLDPVHD